MESNNLVVDTSIFIEYLRAKDKRKTILFSIPADTKLFISAVTLYELHMGATSTEKERDIQILTEGIPVLPFNDEVAIHASVIYHQLRTTNKLIEFRDIFIAATCIVYNLSLKTTNNQHFNRINGLVLS